MNSDRRIRVLVVFGTRPEAIKMAPVVAALRRFPEWFVSTVCVTAQHRQMLDSVLHLFRIAPQFDLNVMREDQSLTETTTAVLQGIGKVLDDFKPHVVLVQGDTTTTFAASLAAYYRKTPVGHVEAGLRTNDKFKPFPEELNRRLATQLSDLHFAPTVIAKNNLLREGIPAEYIFVTGNTIVDALTQIAAAQDAPNERARLESALNQLGIVFSPQDRNLLVTAHRREHFGEPLHNICIALKKIASAVKDVHIIYPVHSNPNVREPVHAALGCTANISLIAPVDYEQFVYLMTKADLILTDSGGIQEEAPSLGKQVLVMRDKTERPEAVSAGFLRIVGTRTDVIVDETLQALHRQEAGLKILKGPNPYGDGTAAEAIVTSLRQYFFDINSG